MSEELKPYTVTSSDLENTNAVWDDLTNLGSSSETVPEREVEVANERPENANNTVYYLTDEDRKSVV